jgi:hypothetical protein
MCWCGFPACCEIDLSPVFERMRVFCDSPFQQGQTGALGRFPQCIKYNYTPLVWWSDQFRPSVPFCNSRAYTCRCASENPGT